MWHHFYLQGFIGKKFYLGEEIRKEVAEEVLEPNTRRPTVAVEAEPRTITLSRALNAKATVGTLEVPAD